MKKLVIKTVVIVLSVIVCAMAITFGVLCSTNPKAIAKGFESLGNYSASKYFYEMQYNKTDDIDDLLVLIDNAYAQKDKVGMQNYLGELISHKYFNQYCNEQNEGLTPSAMKSEEYYSGFYANVLYENGKFNGVLRFCSSYVNTMGYTAFNPFRSIIESKLSVLTAEQKTQIKTVLNGLLSTISDSGQISLINQDINKLG